MIISDMESQGITCASFIMLVCEILIHLHQTDRKKFDEGLERRVPGVWDNRQAGEPLSGNSVKERILPEQNCCYEQK